MEEKCIALKDVSLQFHSGFAIDRLTFSVQRGEIFGFLGPSGAGKTTTIKLLTKQLQRRAGEITLLGKEIDRVGRGDFDRIGILSDTSNLYDRMTLEANLKFFARLRGISEQRVKEVLEQVNLSEQRKQPFKKCSKGMKQRAVLAGAVLHKPELLFLDEPTAGLDPSTSREIHKLLLALNRQGTTIFLTTHNMEEADKLCNRVGIINGGRLIACCKPEDLKLRYARDEVRVLTGDRRMVTVKKDRQGGAEICRLLEEGNCLTIHSSEPDLEEIFLELTGREFQ